MSGSRGEANFVWRCKTCKVGRSEALRYPLLNGDRKRESTASIKSSPNAYAQSSPPKLQTILEFDCRGLEFVEFKADVRSFEHGLSMSLMFMDRESGLPRVWSRARNSSASICKRGNGSITMKKQEKR